MKGNQTQKRGQGSEEMCLRRQPQQARGQQRVTAILNAAEELFAEMGYEATTTNAIAARAHTSIGSLYQFFPHKKAILLGVFNRYHEQYRELIQNILTDDFFFQPLPIAFDRLISALLALHEQHGGIRSFFMQSDPASELALETRKLQQDILARLDQLLGARLPHLSSSERRITLRITYNVTQTLLDLTKNVSPAEKSIVLSSLKTMVLAYLTPLLEGES